jgi:acyl-CoA synthetase (AMP-forming)/AMP-acid ligase II
MANTNDSFIGLQPRPVSEYPFDTLTNLGNTINQNYDLDKISIIDLSQRVSREFSFRKINRLSNNMAVSLKRKQIHQGDKVALIARNSIEFIVTLFGIYRIGAVAVPLNYKMPKKELDYMITDSDSKLIFTDGRVKFTNAINLIEEFENLTKDRDVHVPLHVDDIKEALILYTTGSTGRPKGIVIGHANHLWMVTNHRIQDRVYGKYCKTLISTPMCHMNGLSTVQKSIASHSTVVLLPEFDAKKYLKVIPKYKINRLYAVPPMLAMMVEEKTLIDKADLSSVKVIYMASAPLSSKLLSNVKRYFPQSLVFNSYGLTEMGPSIFGPHPKNIPRPNLSVGYPDPRISVRIVDGILQIKSPGMMLGYNNRPDLYSESVTSDGYFITKDLFTVDENGFYYFVDRADDMFKSGGNTVYPSKIEEILETHSEVDRAVVLGIEDDIKGKKPYAFVTRKNNNLTEETLKNYVLKKAAPYMLPRRIWFLDTLPVNGTNKIDKKTLEKMALTNLSLK